MSKRFHQVSQDEALSDIVSLLKIAFWVAMTILCLSSFVHHDGHGTERKFEEVDR